jgi:hypothetical protein
MTIFLLVYVDDIIIANSSSSDAADLLQDLKSEFALKDLGPLNYFLSIEVAHFVEGVHFSQKKYTYDIVHHPGMATCKPAPTPLSYSTKISAHDEVPLSPEDAT